MPEQPRTAISAYPLQWPGGWPKATAKESARFKTKLSAALSALKREVSLLGGTGLVLSSNVTLGDERPKEPGVCAYFDLRKQSIAIPCDRWNKVEDNVKAIALTIEAMRGMERWGAKHMITAMFTGFKALPEQTMPKWFEILGCPENATKEEINKARLAKINLYHPDRPTADPEKFHQVSEAYRIAMELRS